MKAFGALLVLVIAALSFAGLGAYADVSVPPLTARVIDETGTLTGEQRSSLERTLKDFEASKGTQISVLIVPTTQPETIEQGFVKLTQKRPYGSKRVALLIKYH